MTDKETIAELQLQLRAYEATVHNLNLKNEAMNEAIAAKSDRIGLMLNYIDDLKSEMRADRKELTKERDALRSDLEAVGAGGVQSLSPKKPAQTQHQQAVAAINSVAQKPGETMVSWKLVPVDATEEMVRATDCVNFANADTDGTMHDVWRAMIAAAPQPAVAAGVSSSDLWRQAVIDACMSTEACFDGNNPAATINNLIDWHLQNERFHVAQESASNQLPPAPIAAAAGWVMVPVEPNQKQIKAAADAWLDCGSKLILNKALAALRAGIAAAPIAGESNE